jgi:hypothetical protein
MAARERTTAAMLGLIAAGFLLGGCGLAAEAGNEPIKVTVTREFGARSVANVSVARGSETVAQLLARSLHAKVASDGSVQSIDGVSAGAGNGTWSYYINGISSTISATALKFTKVHAGDQVWWDLHDATATSTVRAVVGAYPEPFEHGISGRRLPTTLECGQGVAPACKRVSTALTADGVKVATQLMGTGSGEDSLGVVVGTWNEVEGQLVATIVDHGPSASGIYARFTRGGASLQLLNARGQVVRTLGPGAGLIAATRDSQSEPTWLITGADAAGVTAAARALNAGALKDHFAVAVASGRVTALPTKP